MLNVIFFVIFVAILTASIYHLENTGRMDQRWAGICSVVSGVFLMSLVWADWGFGRLKDERRHFQGIDLPLIGYVSIFISLAIIVIGLLAALEKIQLAPGWSIPGALVAFFGTVFLIICESASRLIPSFIVPKTIRRFTVDVGAGVGVWLCVPVATIAAVSLSGRLPELTQRSFEAWNGLVINPIRTAIYCCFVLATGFLVGSRYMPWLNIQTLNNESGIPGWAVPFVGPSTLFALMFIFVGAGVFFLRHQIYGLIIVGLSTSFLAMIATMSFTFGTFVDGSISASWVARFYEDLDMEAAVHRGPGALVMFLSSLGITVSLASLVDRA